MQEDWDYYREAGVLLVQLSQAWTNCQYLHWGSGGIQKSLLRGPLVNHPTKKNFFTFKNVIFGYFGNHISFKLKPKQLSSFDSFFRNVLTTTSSLVDKRDCPISAQNMNFYWNIWKWYLSSQKSNRPSLQIPPRHWSGSASVRWNGPATGFDVFLHARLKTFDFFLVHFPTGQIYQEM